ncbi:nicotinamide-nucleotide adenylyltransferase, NadR type [Belliella buryatensis]|uniref:Nicotinamide-nucleotide adenylyltransferase, NadR type n=1 Tax=Belliella buryatensis TaxID=1500549 RepID=A0A239BKD5_9BACT|nr:ATP-binding protein [Belliella buryatensis]SNS08082.1 nicotinamide-nucleotide adenylyltransferase, NadR type [Belliella buryatensis]
MSIKRIVVIGPESTGKSTLSQALAAAFDEPWVMEFARVYIERLERPYQYEDLLEIAKGQLREEDAKSKRAKKMLFIDTDLHVLKVWSEHKYGKTDPWIIGQIAQRKYDLYLLTDVDLPWEEDSQREHPQPEMRAYLFEQYHQLIKDSGVPYAIIKGKYDERFVNALRKVREMLA